MGLLVDGNWRDKWYETEEHGGRFVRSAAAFRNWITKDGSPGETGIGGFPAVAGRYRLYVSLACPWAHRTLIVRRLKGLEDAIDVSIVHWHMGEEGWVFKEGPGVVADPQYGTSRLHQLYTRAKPDYSGRVTVPVLWDTERHTVVSNESSEIIRMFNSEFDDASGPDLFPEPLQEEIERINERVYATVNNGVYKAGFATTQEAYEEAVTELFESLDWLEALLGEKRYLTGDRFTEADIRLFTTLIRFDPVYVGHFKCNVRRIADYPSISGFMREVYQMPAVRPTVNLHHIKHHYYESHPSVNPTGVVPVGPALDWDAPHGRG